jgi:hypothetical protein
VHDRWLRSQSFTLPGLQLAFDIAYDTMLTTVARLRMTTPFGPTVMV